MNLGFLYMYSHMLQQRSKHEKASKESSPAVTKESKVKSK